MDTTSPDRGLDAAVMVVAAGLARLRGHREVLKNEAHAPATAPRDILRVAMAFQAAAFDQPLPLQPQPLPASSRPSDSINETGTDKCSGADKELNFSQSDRARESALDTYWHTGREPISNLPDFVCGSVSDASTYTSRDRLYEEAGLSGTVSAPGEHRSRVAVMA